jgi:hypothetical protein
MADMSMFSTEMEQLKNDILGLLKQEVKDLWKQEDEAFLVQIADDIAREKILYKTSGNPAEHERNLLHLAATIEGEVARKKLKMGKRSQEVFVRVVSTVIKTVALTALSAI